MAPLHGSTRAENMEAGEYAPLQYEKQKIFGQELVSSMVRNRYTWEKVSFIRRVYSVVILLCLVSFLISIPFIKHQMGTVNWLYSEHNWVLWLAGTVMFLQLGFYLTVLGFLMTGQRLLFLVYVKLLTVFPGNFLWALFYVVSFTILVDTALASFHFAYLSFTFLYTMVMVIALLLYTYGARDPGFRTLHTYLIPVFTAILIWFYLRFFVDVQQERFEHTVSVLLSIVLGWIAVYETQLIFGVKIERGRKYPYELRMYAMAAYEMYFDLFINYYLGALGLMPASPENTEA